MEKKEGERKSISSRWNTLEPLRRWKSTMWHESSYWIAQFHWLYVYVRVYIRVYTCEYMYVISYARQFFQDQNRGDGTQDRILLMAVARCLCVVLSSRTKIFTREITCNVRVISTSKCRAELDDRRGASNRCESLGLLFPDSAIFRSLVARRVFNTKEDRAKE